MSVSLWLCVSLCPCECVSVCSCGCVCVWPCECVSVCPCGCVCLCMHRLTPVCVCMCLSKFSPTAQNSTCLFTIRRDTAAGSVSTRALVGTRLPWSLSLVPLEAKGCDPAMAQPAAYLESAAHRLMLLLLGFGPFGAQTAQLGVLRGNEHPSPPFT